MENIPYEIRAWQLNQTFELIKNCQVVKPPYDKWGFYSAEFFLDKRNGLTALCTDPTKNFLDNINIKGQEYYYYQTWNNTYLWVLASRVITAVAGPFPVTSDSPKRLAYGRNIYGPKYASSIVRDPLAGTGRNFTVQWMAGYADGYVQINQLTAGIETGDYIVFTGDSVLRGGLNRVEDIDTTTITTNNPIAVTNVCVSLNNAPFFVAAGTVSISPGPGSSTPLQSSTIVSSNLLTGIVTLTTPVTSAIGDLISYGNNIYIIGTNSRWSVPKHWDTFDIYKKSNSIESNCILIGHNDANGNWVVSMCLMNGTYSANVIKVLEATSPVIDIVNFDQNVFVLTKRKMYHSRSTIDDNTQFYPLDNFSVDEWEKLFPMGKALFLFGRKNKLFSTITANIGSTSNVPQYAGYDVNYTGSLYSKYATVFSDQTIYVLQKDLQLMQVDIVANNNSTFDIATKNILVNTRGIFERITGSAINIAVSSKHLSYMALKDWTTTVYQFDKQYQHWLVNEYKNLTINKFWEIVLLNGYIAEVGTTFTDFWVAYDQEVNFSLNGGGPRMNMPYILRTVFGMVDSIFDVKLDAEFEIGGKNIPFNIRIHNLDLDNRFSEELTGDELIGWDVLPYEVSEYNGNTFSIQTTVLKTWRYIRFKYNSDVRFCIGDSFIFTDFTKPFINEVNKSI